ncbi:MAG: phosphatidate cytidylyltransferase [Dysgonamonadaceae bacterium]|jgi:phosphatidate cytidylyltransferase|nr:phosphatidate cytidylyltransferase [Dysgonamonadaceae bacterium]
MKNLLIRTLSGLIYILLILSGICFGTLSYVAVFGLLVVLCLYEFYQLMNANESVTVRPLINCAAGLYFFIATFLYLSSGQANGILYLPYILYVLGILIMELYLKRPNPIQNWAYAFLGQLYIVLPLSTLHTLCLSFDPAASVTVYSPVLLLALFSFIWINDTFAYLVGMTFGKHRLFERISPKKSWEGFVGGAVFSIASSFAFAHYVPEIPRMHWICMSVVTVIFATWGDLIESLLKRTLGVKDSGKMIPGHGGILDRMDSVLLAAPALACCFYLLGEM